MRGQGAIKPRRKDNDMPRVTHVERARKDNPVCKAGESYYWWKFRYGGKHYSLTYPRPSQLTQSEFLSCVYSAQEEIEDWGFDVAEDLDSNAEDLRSTIESAKDEIQNAGEECESNRYNMPDHLQDVGSGAMLEERTEHCENMVAELDNIYIDESEFEEDTSAEADELVDQWMEFLNEKRDEAAMAAEFQGE